MRRVKKGIEELSMGACSSKQLSYPLFSALSLSSHALPQTQAALASDRSMLIKAARVFQIAWDVIKRVIPLESLQELTTD